MPPTAAATGSAAFRGFRQPTDKHLPFYFLKPDGKEKQGHQAVIYPVGERMGESRTADGNGELRCQKWRIRAG